MKKPTNRSHPIVERKRLFSYSVYVSTYGTFVSGERKRVMRDRDFLSFARYECTVLKERGKERGKETLELWCVRQCGV